MILYLVLVLSIFLPVEQLSAATYYVATTGNDTTGTGSSGSPWRTIQKCHDIAVSGDICSVNSGIYTTSATGQMVLVSKSGITFKSTTPLGAKLSGNSNVTGIGFNFSAGNNVTIQDFEIYGFSTDGISLANGSNITNPTIRGNIIHDIGRVCSSSAFGLDGIFLGNTITGAVIDSNIIHTVGRFQNGENGCGIVGTGQNDHGIYVDGGGNATIQRNLFYNILVGFPIQVYPNASSGLRILNNTFSDTSTHVNGQILIGTSVSSSDISNNIFYIPNGGAIRVTTSASFSNVTVRNNLVSNTNPLFTWQSGASGTPAGITISANALNVNPLFTNVASRDYTLQAGSPAIDTGVNVGLSFNGTAPDKGYWESGSVITAGFVEPQGTLPRTRWTLSFLSTFLPTSRGPFTFPSPYSTNASRITDPTDCAGFVSDCVKYIGYSYWANMNYHVAGSVIRIFVGLEGPGVTLYQYNKTTRAVTKDVPQPLRTLSPTPLRITGEGWYWSGTRPNDVYYITSTSLQRYDVSLNTNTQIFNVTTLNSSYRIDQASSSRNDQTHVATLLNGTTPLGCVVYRVLTGQFTIYPRTVGASGTFDECNITIDGRYVIMQDDTNGDGYNDNLIFDTTNGSTSPIYTEMDGSGKHGLAHIAAGFGYAVGADNWGSVGTNGHASSRWDYTTTPPTWMGIIFQNGTTGLDRINHTSHLNAQNTALNKQFVCGSNLSTTSTIQDEVTCTRVDGSTNQLIVAPIMTDNAATGGQQSCSDFYYCKSPKGNLDVTGRYFIWTSNLGSSRLDAFIVEVPYELLVGTITIPTPDTTPPAAVTGVSITKYMGD